MDLISCSCLNYFVAQYCHIKADSFCYGWKNFLKHVTTSGFNSNSFNLFGTFFMSCNLNTFIQVLYNLK